ncbi:MAG: hypothetical protein FWF63_00405 [Fibromonadales bacterium]|nr:hypothetical protein [Fibromonadales bacterium]
MGLVLPKDYPKEVKDTIGKIIEESKSGKFGSIEGFQVWQNENGSYLIETEYILNGKRTTQNEYVFIKKKGC